MKAKYQKYYDALKGANLSGGVSKISSAVNTAKSGLSSMQSSLSASSWTELGAMTINNVTIPSMIKDVDLLNTNVTGALTQVATKCTELVSKLTELEALETKKESLGSKWTYTEGGSKTQSEVNSHNNEIDDTEKKITEKEGEIDALIAEINAIELAKLEETNTDTGTQTDNTGTDVLNDGSIAAKKKAFLGNVDDPNNYEAVNPNFSSIRKTMQLFDNTTGEIIQDHGTIHMKPGETRVITVKLPTNTGMIGEIHRTTADGNGVYRSGKVVTAKSDVDPDPNVVDYVNYKSYSNHWPKDKSVLHSNSYDWIITANADGTVQCSQTCEYTTNVSKGANLKAMINLNVVVG